MSTTGVNEVNEEEFTAEIIPPVEIPAYLSGKRILDVSFNIGVTGPDQRGYAGLKFAEDEWFIIANWGVVEHSSINALSNIDTRMAREFLIGKEISSAVTTQSSLHCTAGNSSLSINLHKLDRLMVFVSPTKDIFP